MDENGLNVAVEKIVAIAVKAKIIQIHCDKSVQYVTSETMKELIKLPHFSKLEILKFDCLSEACDLEIFYCYMKKNGTTKIWLHFHDSISETYKNRLEEIVNEILATETHDYKPPCINFDGLDEEKLCRYSEL